MLSWLKRLFAPGGHEKKQEWPYVDVSIRCFYEITGSDYHSDLYTSRTTIRGKVAEATVRVACWPEDPKHQEQLSCPVCRDWIRLSVWPPRSRRRTAKRLLIAAAVLALGVCLGWLPPWPRPSVLNGVMGVTGLVCLLGAVATGWLGVLVLSTQTVRLVGEQQPLSAQNAKHQVGEQE
jgi:hypothetical protein